MMEKPMNNVLLIAYACEPNKTSEPGVGWYFSKEIAKFSKVTVLTRSNNKERISNEDNKDINFIYYDLPVFFQKLKKRIPFGTQIYYSLWQWQVYFKMRKYSLEHNIDIIHHLNFSVSWNPPPFFLINKPVIWGPVGGNDIVPYRFLKCMGFTAIIKETIYVCLSKIRLITQVLLLRKRHKRALLVRTRSALKSVNKQHFDMVDVISETATLELPNTLPSSRITDLKEIRAMCVGRGVYWKGFYSAVKGFHSFLKNGGKGTLEIYGEGPELGKIRNYIKSNNLQLNIKLMGFVDNIKIQKAYSHSNVLLHPSFRDGGSWSILEAMSHGLPVICLDTSGPRDMVIDSCGILIPLTTPKQVSEDIGAGLLSLFKDQNLLNKLGENARERIKYEYTWAKRNEQIKKVYDLFDGKTTSNEL